ncbi:cyclic nucleotide-binding domain-containing protein [Oscillibacter sp.]|uniref:Crp/Fnr family transcriptional regulator n=1 Tax=Oscillibacter sp. TaxID=1945593 RepID=UPI0033990C23
MLSPEELKASPIFEGISYQNYLLMIDCFQAIQKTYRPEDVAYNFEQGGEQVGILERGEASLIRIDEDGVSTVLENLTVGSVFGRSLAFYGGSGDSMEVVCRTACDVLYIDFPHILKRCEKACVHHSLLVQNMLMLITGKAQVLAERIDVLSRRSIREKLLCFFHQQVEKTGKNSFMLPFSLSMLADYIATDRSAMMREMKHLREEDLIRTDGREITLLG